MLDVIHVGFPKCASTFIQNVLLPKTPGLHYIDMHNVISDLQKDDAFYSPAKIKDALDSQTLDDHINVASSEYIINYFLHWTRSIDRLATLYPKAKALVVIRNQPDFFLSYYQEKIRGGAGFNFDDFVKQYCQSNGVWNTCQYSFVIEKLQKSFSRVRIQLYETMFSESEMANLLTFLGDTPPPTNPILNSKKVNAKHSPASHYATLLINKLQPTKLQGFRHYMMQEYFQLYMTPALNSVSARIFPSWRVKIPQKTLEFITDYYSQDNKKLQSWFDTDIRELGYKF
jgi:hypothetical protein